VDTRKRASDNHKEGRALRTETTINDTRDFGIGKRLTNLPALRAIGFQANRRLLAVERLSHDPAVGQAALRQISQPLTSGTGTRIAGLRLGDPRAHALLAALCMFRLLPCGFANSDLRPIMARLLGLPAESITPGKMTYDLRRLRQRGFIARIPHTFRYQVTDAGLAQAVLRRADGYDGQGEPGGKLGQQRIRRDPGAAGGAAAGCGQQRTPPPAVRQDLMGAGRAGAAGRLAGLGAAREHAGAYPRAGDQADGGSGDDPWQCHRVCPPRLGHALRRQQLARAGDSARVMILKLNARTKIDFKRLLQHLPRHPVRNTDRTRAIGACGEIDHELAQPMCARERGQARDVDQFGQVAGGLQPDPRLRGRLT